ncbi:MAG TPA: ABC transporter ATP-binding protein [Nitrososphaerales archaeon]|nr:ABC transporter ATP-binding protein [Nitrososphaerales archaeon]
MSYGHGTFGSDDPNERKLRKYSDSQIVRELAAYILRYRKDFGIVLATLLLAALFGVVGPSLIGLAVNDIVSRDIRGVAIMISLFTVVNVVGYFAESRRLYHMQLLGQNVIYDLRADSFEKLQKLSPSYYSKRETGRIMSYITNDVDALSDFVTFQLPAVLSGVLVIVSIIVIMFVYNVSLTLVSLTVIPPLVILTVAMQGRIQRSYVETRKKIAIVTSKLQEGISGVRVTQSLAKQEKINERFDQANAENLEANLQANRLTSLFNSLVQVIESFGMAIVLWYGATEILGGHMLVGTLVTFLIYVNSFFNPIIQLTTFYNSYQAAVTGLDRVMQVLHTEVEVKEPQSAIVPEFRKGMGGNVPLEIRFEDITFGYEPDQPVLKNVNLVIEKNSVLAIVGPTGAGKSSIVNLILRFYDPQKGRVTFNGVDLKRLSFKDLRGLISVIPQDPFLFSGTIMDNIRYGSPDASDEQVIALARRIGLDEFVRSLPLGYATMISEGATNLSMGQKQLICFARAFLPDPRILIMDEATSGVDPHTELQLQKALAAVLEGRTSIIIAHRLSTIRLADKIVVLRDGMIQESGSFQELLSKENGEGLFAKMYAMQTEVIE